MSFIPVSQRGARSSWVGQSLRAAFFRVFGQVHKETATYIRKRDSRFLLVLCYSEVTIRRYEGSKTGSCALLRLRHKFYEEV